MRYLHFAACAALISAITVMPAGAQVTSITSVPAAAGGVVTLCPATPITISVSLFSPYGETWSPTATVELYEQPPAGTWNTQPTKVITAKIVTNQSGGGTIYNYVASFSGLVSPPGTSYRATFKYQSGFTPRAMTKTTGALAVAAKSFMIRRSDGVWVAPPADGEPTSVSLDGGARINISSMAGCGGAVFLTVQESNQWWDRTYAHEWGQWFQQASLNLSDIDLQFMTSMYSSQQGTGFFTLLGSNISSTRPPGPESLVGQKRYYRVGVQVGSVWAPQYGLIEVQW
jgi:hypothetical protein